MNKKIKNILKSSFMGLTLLLCSCHVNVLDHNNIKKVNAESPFDNGTNTSIINGTDILSQDYNGGYVDYTIYDEYNNVISNSIISLSISNEYNQYYVNFTLNDSEWLGYDGFYLYNIVIGWDDLSLNYNTNYLLCVSFGSSIYNESTFYGINQNDERSLLIPFNSGDYYEDFNIPQNYSSLYYLDNYNIYSDLVFTLSMNFDNTSYPLGFSAINQVVRIPLFKIKLIEISNNTEGIYSNSDNLQANYNYGYQNGLNEGRNIGYQEGVNSSRINDYNGLTYQQIYDNGFNSGYSNGVSNGEENGKAIGRQETIDNTYQGKTYQQIYTEGVLQGERNTQSFGTLLPTLFGSLVNIPISVLNGLAPLTFFDLSIIKVVITLLMLNVILWIIRKVLI